MNELKDNLAKLVFDFQLANIRNLGESQTRLSFIDKFWNYLGWDVSNLEQVQVEVTDRKHQRPDYRFMKGRNKVAFFVEAKKPAENLKNPKHIYQTMLYCWNGSVPMAILTDFEEFRPFRAIGKPKLEDWNKGLIKQFDITYEAYPDLAYELLNNFGREAVLGGSLDALVKPTKLELRDTVDKHFLNSLSIWRTELATQINKSNNFANEFEISEAIQRILDRLVFLRILQDRDIETIDYIRLISSFKVGDVYSEFVKICKQLAPKYNGLIFNPHPLSENLKVESTLFKKIVKELVYEDSPYRFDEMPVETLGTIYERFLGDEINLDNKGKVVIDAKPEVRKAGGVYYTPQYIVEYIVQNTVGKLLYGDLEQGLGTWDLGLDEEDNQNKNKYYEDENDGQDSNLQGFGSLEKSNGYDRNDLQNNNEFPEGRKIRVDEPNSESGSLSAGEHSGGQRKRLHEGIHISPVGSEGLSGRTRNTSDISSTSEVYNSGRIQKNLDANPNSKQTINRTLKSNKSKTKPKSQAPSPKSLTPADVAKLKILDPACGSGSFLLGAFDLLIKWHEDFFSANPGKALEKSGKQSYLLAYPDKAGQTKLTARMKGKILQNNIYGVDLDKQATEVAQMSLYIKVLEGMANESQMSLGFRDAILPKLDDNIKCGNSLIGTDFIHDDFFGLSEKERHKINPFDWEENFPFIKESGGFDAVIGNPPYRTLQLGKKQESENIKILNYYENLYKNSFSYKVNLFALFIERVTSTFLKDNGLFSYIVPNAINNAFYFSNLRKYLIEEGNIFKVVDLRYRVFEDAEIGGNTIFLFLKSKNQNNDILFYTISSEDEFDKPQKEKILISDIINDENYLFTSENFTNVILKRIKTKTVELGKLTKIYQGIITGDNKKFLSNENDNDKWQKIIRGRDINRYKTEFADIYVYYEPKLLWSNTDLSMFKVEEKIISRQTSNSLIATLDENQYFSLDSTHVIHLIDDSFSLKYLLGIYNSKFLNYIYQNRIKETGRVYPQVKVVNIKPLPIRIIDLANKQEKAQHDKMVELVERMLKLHKDLAKASDFDRKHIETFIKNTDKEIDTLVYELYGLTNEEIKIIENG